MKDIKILDAVPEDALGMTTVFYKAWLKAYPNEEAGVTMDDIEDSYKDSFTEEGIGKMQEKLKQPRIKEKRLVAKEGDLIVGTATMVRNEENNQLRTIYVLPEYQGKGIGKMLWEEARKFCDPEKDTIVQVVTYNEQAINFYMKLGFVDTGKRFTEERFKMKSGAILPEMEMVLRKD